MTESIVYTFILNRASNLQNSEAFSAYTLFKKEKISNIFLSKCHQFSLAFDSLDDICLLNANNPHFGQKPYKRELELPQ